MNYWSGAYEHVFESTTAGVTIQAPQLDVNTVAAGGGSMLFFRSGLFVVGPESASAHPGPVCYRYIALNISYYQPWINTVWPIKLWKSKTTVRIKLQF